MKHAILLFLFFIGTNHSSQISEQWWAEAKSLGQKVASLKTSRREETSKITSRVFSQTLKIVEKNPSLSFGNEYDKLMRKAEPELIAIRQKYDPQVNSAMANYLTFLREQKPAQAEPEAAKQTLRPTILYQEKAKYTEAARQNRIEGTVTLRMIFQSDGAIGRIEPVDELPHGLTDEAIKAAREIVFMPAVKDGRMVSVRMSVQYSFKLL